MLREPRARDRNQVSGLRSGASTTRLRVGYKACGPNWRAVLARCKPLIEAIAAVKAYALAHPTDGYRRLTWMMLDSRCRGSVRIQCLPHFARCRPHSALESLRDCGRSNASQTDTAR